MQVLAYLIGLVIAAKIAINTLDAIKKAANANDVDD